MSAMIGRRQGRSAGKLPYYAALMAMLILQASPTPVPAHESTSEPANNRPSLPRPRIAAERAPADPAAAPETNLPDLVIHTELPITAWLRPGEYAWNDDGVPAGPATIVVNLKGRVLSVYRAGFEIGRSSIIYGADDKPTPTGTFPILEKDAVHFSSTYDNAPMPHMLRLTMDGVALHGSELADDLGTHGCVGLPKEFAALLFSAARVGDRVMIWQGDRRADAPRIRFEARASRIEAGDPFGREPKSI